MTAATTSPLRFRLPTALITVSAAVRLTVVADAKGGHLEPEVAIALATRGQSRPLASASTVAATPGASWLIEGNLRATFDRQHPKTASLIMDLSMRAEQYLSVLRMGEDVSEIATCGRVLSILNEQLAAADRMRREWLAAQGRGLRAHTQDLTHEDLVTLTSCPSELPAEVTIPSAAAQMLADNYGVLFARVESASANPAVAVPATMAVFRRAPIGHPDIKAPGADDPWVRDNALSHVHLVDDDTLAGYEMPQDGTVKAALAPDLAQIQLDLLMASDECTQLAATHARAEELAMLESASRLVRLPGQRS